MNPAAFNLRITSAQVTSVNLPLGSVNAAKKAEQMLEGIALLLAPGYAR
jgi:hypothetical protein